MLFIDTSDVKEIKKYIDLGIIQGITTNQKILLKDNQTNITRAIQRILDVSCNLPVNVELTNTSGTDDELIFEAYKYFDLSKNIVIKIPMWRDGRGIRLAWQLKKANVPVNITCCMSVEQALMAAAIKAEYVSFFFNRIIDYYSAEEALGSTKAHSIACTILSTTNGLLTQICSRTRIIAGSIRQPADVVHSLENGADIVTVPPEILSRMFYHPKTESTIQDFDNAWKELQGKKDT